MRGPRPPTQRAWLHHARPRRRGRPTVRDGQEQLTAPGAEQRDDSYFVRIDEHRFRPTAATSGAWSTAEQHFSPLGGLLTHEIERFAHDSGTSGLLTSRITFDILGTIRVDDFSIHVDVVRPGRTIELLEAIVTAEERPAVRARAWRLASFDTRELAGGEPPPLPPPNEVARGSLSTVWPGGYIASIEYRPIVVEPGHATVWLKTPLSLVTGEEIGSLARFVTLLDTANGIGVRLPPDSWFYPNVDLSIHLYRQPVGEWVGLDTHVVFGPTGQGVTSSTLYDVEGAVGRAEQMLTIRKRS